MGARPVDGNGEDVCVGDFSSLGKLGSFVHHRRHLTGCVMHSLMATLASILPRLRSGRSPHWTQLVGDK